MTYAHATEVALLHQELADWLAEQAAEDDDPAGPCWLCFGVSGYWADEWQPCPQCEGSGYQPR